MVYRFRMVGIPNNCTASFTVMTKHVGIRGMSKKSALLNPKQRIAMVSSRSTAWGPTVSDKMLAQSNALRLQELKQMGSRVICLDISQGKEPVAIPVVNEVDDEGVPEFEYVTDYKITSDLVHEFIANAATIQQKQGRCEIKPCALTTAQGLGVRQFFTNGQLLESNSMGVYECSSSCTSKACETHRVVQKGVRQPLEVFRTEQKGWGVRCKNTLQGGDFIAAYLGELLHDLSMDSRTDDMYFFDLNHFE